MPYLAQELLAPYLSSMEEIALPIYGRINVDKESDVETFITCLPRNAVPILVKEAHTNRQRFDDAHLESFIDQYSRVTKNLDLAGIKRIVIAADRDSLLQKALSPRFSTDSIWLRQKPLLRLFAALKEIMTDVRVLLTIEELAPGGLDPTDGIQVAQSLENLGLREIIATYGTRDFMPLYDRRSTRKKSDPADFLSNEPGLASALWLKQYTNLSVACCAFIHEPSSALELAKSLGLAGLIKKAQINDT